MANEGGSLFEAFGSPGDALVAPAAQLTVEGARAHAGASAAALRLMGKELEKSLVKILSDLDVFDLGVRAWTTLRDLQKYRDKAEFPAAVSSVVTLTKHSLKSSHQPAIELLMNGKPLVTLRLDLEFAAVFDGLALTIQDGCIRKIAPGRCHGEVSLAYKKKSLWREATDNLSLPGVLDLGEGVAIPAL